MKAYVTAYPLDKQSCDFLIKNRYSYSEGWGLTVRDYIAIEAMNGFCMNSGRNGFISNKPEIIAEAAYKLADAMIVESNK